MTNPSITDSQVEAAAKRMRLIIEAAENSNQNGEDALMCATAAPDMMRALEDIANRLQMQGENRAHRCMEIAREAIAKARGKPNNGE